MITLQHSKKQKKNDSLVLVVKDLSMLDKYLSEGQVAYFEKSLNGEKKFDFLKTEKGYICVVKANQAAEELRACGAKVQALVAAELEELSVLGNTKQVLEVLEGVMLANYQFIPYQKEKEKKTHKLQKLLISDEIDDKSIHELENKVKAVFWVRDRVNEPVSHLNAEQLAEHAKLLEQDTELEVQILEKMQIESLKMGGLLAVNQGSIDPPTFTIVEYKPKKAKNKKPIVLVGKGVVYDTGGLSIKPTPGSMDIMKSDMAGGAAVLGAIYLAALQKLNVHVVALVPATDNRLGENAYAPGDVVTMFDGTTVEVLNTDAEGRMILADALAYADKYKPELVIDLATLTGAALRAIGTHAAIAMGNAKDEVFEQLEKAGNNVHERVVRFPFWDDYAEEMKSSIADLKNLGGPNAGMITAGKFLEHFVKAPYIHIDIAGPAWLDKKETYRGVGGTGMGVRLLYDFLKNYK